jgi:hypothetical protein
MKLEPKAKIAPDFREVDESIFDMLETIRKRPAFYLPERSLIQLSVFIGAYMAGLGRVGFKLKDDLREFNNWVAQKLGYSNSTSGYRMILDKSGSDREAFDKFFEFLDEFRKK